MTEDTTAVPTTGHQLWETWTTDYGQQAPTSRSVRYSDAWVATRLRQAGAWHDRQQGMSLDDIASAWGYSCERAAGNATAYHQRRIDNGWTPASQDTATYPADEDLLPEAFFDHSGGGYVAADQ